MTGLPHFVLGNTLRFFDDPGLYSLYILYTGCFSCPLQGLCRIESTVLHRSHQYRSEPTRQTLQERAATAACVRRRREMPCFATASPRTGGRFRPSNGLRKSNENWFEPFNQEESQSDSFFCFFGGKDLRHPVIRGVFVIFRLKKAGE